MFLVGIDLGTSNCAAAFVNLDASSPAVVQNFPILQLEAPGSFSTRPLLPSTLYLPGEHELSPEATRLPWGDSPRVIGHFARAQGSRVPGRLVASAKSWLCHPQVDRTAAILPWGAPPDMPRISPVDASAYFLSHIRQAWNHEYPGAPLEEQEVVLTVPASFDEVARALTVNAAQQAGLGKFTLIEEPLAAFYDFTSRHTDRLAEVLADTRLILVVDVGGGTTDFTLIQAAPGPDGPLLRRIAVGEHLLLGGDNMDAALGRRVEERLLAGGRRLSSTQWNQLVQACRAAKETLLAEGGPDWIQIAVAAEGSRMVGGSLTARVERTEAETLVLDGFLPACDPAERPRKTARTGLQELGLPYATDPAITRHLTAFLAAHSAAAWAALGHAEKPVPGIPRPDALLLNGGVFNSPRLAQRLQEVLSRWWPGSQPVRLLAHHSLDLAVARGAACYGMVRHGRGRRISGGAAHAFYIGLDKQAGREPLALCVIPRGHEEGETVELGDRVFRLMLGRPVQFPLFSTTSDRLERAGDVITVSEELQRLPPIHALLKSSSARAGEVPVHLRARLTEIGTLELWCVSNEQPDKWRLEFELRGGVSEQNTAVVEPMPPRFEEASAWISNIYGGKIRPLETKAAPPKDAKQLWSSLERSLGRREDWRVAVLRELWGSLCAGAPKRRRTPDHERVFYQLAGFTLRPGWGYPLDEWRCEQSAAWFSEGVQHHKFKPVWIEFWVMWRRISGGLSENRQLEIWDFLKPHLARELAPERTRVSKPKGIQPVGLDEMVRLAASLEQLPIETKLELGRWLLAKINTSNLTGGPWAWAIGRLGARAPLHGSLHRVVPPDEAQTWVKALLAPPVFKMEGAAFAVAQIARLTGDRARDLNETVRNEVTHTLQASLAPESWRRMVTEIVALQAADSARALGDTLPAGLQLA